MPAKSEAQRRYLNWKFGHSWVKKHHFDNKGKLPQHVENESMNFKEWFRLVNGEEEILFSIRLGEVFH